MEKRTLTLNPRAPYDFHLTMKSQAASRDGAKVDVFEDGQYQRLFDIQGRLLLAQVCSTDDVEHPLLEVTVQGQKLTDDDVLAVSKTVEWVVGTDTPLDDFYTSAGKDPVIGPVLERLYGLHVSRTPTVFEALVQAISSQQIATNVARIIGALLLESYSPTLLLEGRTYYAFPRPTAMLSKGVPGLRSIKLSNRKAEYILDIAAAMEDGSLDLEGLGRLPDAQATQKLLALRGVGRWTAHWILLRALGRRDSFPSGDRALQRTISRLYFKGETLTEAGLDEFSRPWSPRRSLYTTYLFTALRQGLLPS